MKRFLLVLSLVTLFLFASGAVIGASGSSGSSANYSIAPAVFASGGQSSQSVNYSIVATIGQPAVDNANSADYAMCHGFWCGLSPLYRLLLPFLALE